MLRLVNRIIIIHSFLIIALIMISSLPMKSAISHTPGIKIPSLGPTKVDVHDPEITIELDQERVEIDVKQL